ncbi:hypothetical protein [Corynebacterium bovis]|uniref:Uncharacterized protein n=1 Tax=Corynebacterium bovis DSM 20582 = CIP 54.80 TaxID=927655 RepID=A0A8H9Y7G0_9CORY|nr:hypothetical protein [Corynebacterium bovis]MBB3114846.1 hypothetical protein [Corynebacterium bovis DSM 20582 = CIP 54.80]MDH2456150.1 hypothetical protein [Corynebacterium bovis]MDK8511468.1 hypothetical protein [Corynebacterium bovis]MDN8579105.1 hypothetical protein [Corynebacterium bovis]QQC48142.1 hypothetical protein I6I09_04400 [Corynebacterium bovis]
MSDQIDALFKGFSGIADSSIKLTKAIVDTIFAGSDLGSSAIKGVTDAVSK